MLDRRAFGGIAREVALISGTGVPSQRDLFEPRYALKIGALRSAHVLYYYIVVQFATGLHHTAVGGGR